MAASGKVRQLIFTFEVINYKWMMYWIKKLTLDENHKLWGR